MAKTFDSVDAYLAAQPDDARKILRRVRAAIRKALPKATETIAYNMPTYKMDGTNVVHFAGWKQHFSLYPVKRNLAATLKSEIADYALEKGTLRVPYSQAVPVALIERLARLRATEISEELRD